MTRGVSTLRFERNIKASVQDVYRAFTSQAAVEEWLCNCAMIDSMQKTRLYLCWDSGYYTCGEFFKLIPNKEIGFTWLGRNEPAKTRVYIRLKRSGLDTQLVLEHRGIRATSKWQAASENIQKGWEVGLQNLVSILETGRDLRIINKPMLGINLQDFSPEIAASLGIPVSEGVRLESVMSNMGAEQAGLKKDDVIVEVSGMPILGYPSLSNILQKHKAGDRIDVTYYRGSQKNTVSVNLSERPLPSVPASPAELAQIVEEMYDAGDSILAASIENTTESDASFKPGPDEWSVHEVLAHLIHNERDLQFGMHKWLVNESFSYPPNIQTRIDATVAVYPTIPELIQALNVAEAETLAFVRRLPEKFTAQRDSYWYLAYNLLQYTGHLKEHIEQIKSILAKARAR
ncbi:MAG TPA: SRPBCC domain-containing protein [Anaerolineaceae bacterium]|nr:SRPBCC domain-containing protein [Anaerolineaceae bacterium]